MGSEKNPSEIYTAEWFKHFEGLKTDFEFLAYAIDDVFFAPRVVRETGSIIDVGTGPGLLIDFLQRYGHTVWGLEGSEHGIAAATDTIRHKIQKFDLTNPLTSHRRYDLAVCTEVAEHLEAAYAPTLVDTLTALSDTIVFTAAPVGQGGHDHVNEQPPSYWIRLFNARGFDLDGAKTTEMQLKLRGLQTMTWVCSNLMVFRKS